MRVSKVAFWHLQNRNILLRVMLKASDHALKYTGFYQICHVRDLSYLQFYWLEFDKAPFNIAVSIFCILSSGAVIEIRGTSRVALCFFCAFRAQ